MKHIPPPPASPEHFESRRRAQYFSTGKGIDISQDWREPADIADCEQRIRALGEDIDRIEMQLGDRTRHQHEGYAEWRRRAITARAIRLQLRRRYKDWRTAWHRAQDVQHRTDVTGDGGAQRVTLLTALYLFVVPLVEELEPGELQAHEIALLSSVRAFLVERGQLPEDARGD